MMSLDRRKSSEIRDLTELILGRAGFLDPPDRALLQQVLGRGVRPVEVARISGESTRTVQRRVRNLMVRLADPAVVWVLREHRRWDEQRANVALAIWVRGWTLRQAAARLGLSLHTVRRHVEAVRGLVAERGEGRGNGRRWRMGNGRRTGASREAVGMAVGA